MVGRLRGGRQRPGSGPPLTRILQQKGGRAPARLRSPQDRECGPLGRRGGHGHRPVPRRPCLPALGVGLRQADRPADGPTAPLHLAAPRHRQPDKPAPGTRRAPRRVSGPASLCSAGPDRHLIPASPWGRGVRHHPDGNHHEQRHDNDHRDRCRRAQPTAGRVARHRLSRRRSFGSRRAARRSSRRGPTSPARRWWCPRSST